MPVLVLHIADEEPKEIALSKERVTIGRATDNDVVLDDNATSAHHAVVITIGKTSYLQDLKSSNGTLINGSPIQRKALSQGDVILIGRNHFGFLLESMKKPELPPEAKPPEFEFTLPPVPPPTPRPAKAEQHSQPDKPSFSPPQQYTKKEDADLIHQLIESVKSYRQNETNHPDRIRARVDEEWKRVMVHAETLKKRVSSDSRIRYFGIQPKMGEIMIRAQDSAGRSEILIQIMRRHPDPKYPTDAIWFIKNGRDEQRFESAEDVAKELVFTLSHLII
nr:hypothetical protein Hi04_10k_c5801_00035 [uncultured bacterium]